MFKENKIFSSFSVNSIAAAKDFYSQVLGLQVSEKMQGTLALHTGAGKVFLYEKPNHAAATFTVLNFPVADIDQAVEELGSRGIQFERYTNADLQTDEKGILRRDGVNIAWFKDPAGNILSVLEDQES